MVCRESYLYDGSCQEYLALACACHHGTALGGRVASGTPNRIDIRCTSTYTSLWLEKAHFLVCWYGEEETETGS